MKRAGVRFTVNRGVEAELLAGADMRSMLGRVGDSVQGAVPSHLPSGAGGGRAVAPFARRMYVRPSSDGVQVGTRWRLGHIIEYGSVNNPAYAPLRRAAQALGLRLGGG